LQISAAIAFVENNAYTSFMTVNYETMQNILRLQGLPRLLGFVWSNQGCDQTLYIKIHFRYLLMTWKV